MCLGPIVMPLYLLQTIFVTVLREGVQIFLWGTYSFWEIGSGGFSRKFWSGENFVCRTRKYLSACGIMVRAQKLRCKHFNDTSLCRSVCIIVSEAWRNSLVSRKIGPGDQNFQDQNSRDRCGRIYGSGGRNNFRGEQMTGRNVGTEYGTQLHSLAGES